MQRPQNKTIASYQNSVASVFACFVLATKNLFVARKRMRNHATKMGICAFIFTIMMIAFSAASQSAQISPNTKRKSNFRPKAPKLTIDLSSVSTYRRFEQAVSKNLNSKNSVELYGSKIEFLRLINHCVEILDFLQIEHEFLHEDFLSCVFNDLKRPFIDEGQLNDFQKKFATKIVADDIVFPKTSYIELFTFVFMAIVDKNSFLNDPYHSAPLTSVLCCQTSGVQIAPHALILGLMSRAYYAVVLRDLWGVRLAGESAYFRFGVGHTSQAHGQQHRALLDENEYLSFCVGHTPQAHDQQCVEIFLAECLPLFRLPNPAYLQKVTYQLYCIARIIYVKMAKDSLLYTWLQHKLMPVYVNAFAKYFDSQRKSTKTFARFVKSSYYGNRWNLAYYFFRVVSFPELMNGGLQPIPPERYSEIFAYMNVISPPKFLHAKKRT